MLAPALLIVLGVIWSTAPAPAWTRRYTVGDLLGTEAFGRILADPAGRWLVFERRVAFEEAARFDLPDAVARSRLFKVDLAHPGTAQPLIPDLVAPGTILYAFSPGGTRVAVGRLDGERWRLGVVTVATGTTRWFDLSPAYDPFATTLVWASEERLVFVAEQAGTLPWSLRIGKTTSDALPGWWKAMAAGGPAAVTVVGSGRFRQATDAPPEQAILSLDVVTGHADPVVRGRFDLIRSSPDRSWIAIIEEGAAVPLPADASIGLGVETHTHRLLLFNAAHATLWRPCLQCDVANDSLAWSDRNQLAVFGHSDKSLAAEGMVWRFDPAHRATAIPALTGIQPTISGPPDNPVHVDLAWSGRRLLLLGESATDTTHRPDWYRVGTRYPRALTAGLASIGTRIVSSGGCATTMVTSAAAWCLDGPRPHPVLSQMTDVHVDGNDHLIAMRTAGNLTRLQVGAARWSLVGQGSIRPETWSPQTASLIVRSRHDDGHDDLSLLRIGAEPLTLASINLGLAFVEPAQTVPLHYRGSDGVALTSWLYLPPDHDPAHPVPLVVVPYPGSVFTDRPPVEQGLATAPFVTNAQLLAAHGYAVLLPSMPRLSVSTLDPRPFDRQVEAAMAAIPAEAGVDTARTALWGHSFGAYATATIGAATDRFRALIVSAGIYDLASAHGAFPPVIRVAPGNGPSIALMSGWAENGQAGLQATPWTNPLRYVTNSPFFHADRIRTPMMIIAADRDLMSADQAEGLFSALYRQNRDAELLTYWGERHVIQSPANVRDLYARLFAWLDPYLLANPVPIADGPSRRDAPPRSAPIAR
jgi:dienelactone hydrolase